MVPNNNITIYYELMYKNYITAVCKQLFYKKNPFYYSSDKINHVHHDILCQNQNTHIPIKVIEHITPLMIDSFFEIEHNCYLNKWKVLKSPKIPQYSRIYFEEIINADYNKLINMIYYRNQEPHIIHGITNKNNIMLHEETMSLLYKNKGNVYVQAKDKGLYHTGDDIMDFNVKKYNAKQMLKFKSIVISSNHIRLISYIDFNSNTLNSSNYSLDLYNYKLPHQLYFGLK